MIDYFLKFSLLEMSLWKPIFFFMLCTDFTYQGLLIHSWNKFTTDLSCWVDGIPVAKPFSVDWRVKHSMNCFACFSISFCFFYILKADKIRVLGTCSKYGMRLFPRCQHNGRKCSLRANRTHRKDWWTMLNVIESLTSIGEHTQTQTGLIGGYDRNDWPQWSSITPLILY